MDSEPFNYLTLENGATVRSYSSQISHCPARNVLVADRKAIWLSDQGLPQSIVFDISNQIKRPKLYKCFGFDCWHDYASNPNTIELLVSIDGDNFITWTVFRPELKAGVQLFQIDPLPVRYQFLKIIIREAFGASKTYLNSVFLFEENPLKNIGNTQRLEETDTLNNSDLVQEKKENPMPISKTTPQSHKKYDVHPRINQEVAGPFQQIPKHPQTNEKYQQNNNNNFGQVQQQLKRDNNHSQSMPRLANVQYGSAQKMTLSPEQNFDSNQFYTQRPPIQQQPHSTVSKNYQSRDAHTVPHPQQMQQQHQFASHDPSQLVQQFAPDERRLIQEEDEQNWQNYNQDPNKIISNINPQTFQSNAYQSNKSNPQVQFSVLNDQISFASQEVHKLAQMKGINTSNEASQNQELKANQSSSNNNYNNNGNEEDESGFPMLTHSERDVKKMRKEMGKWNKVIEQLQLNMNTLVEKVNVMTDTVEGLKKNPAQNTDQKTSITNNLQHDELTMKASSSHIPLENSAQANIGSGGNVNPLENPIVVDFFESIKHKVGTYLENIESQNEAILDENKRLRQQIETMSLHGGSKEFANSQQSRSDTQGNQSHEITPANLEKAVSVVFEKNMRTWEQMVQEQIRMETLQVEDRVNSKLTNMEEKSYDGRFREKIEDELYRLRRKLELLESTKMKVDMQSYPTTHEDYNGKDHRYQTQLPEKENYKDYQNTRKAPNQVKPFQQHVPSYTSTDMTDNFTSKDTFDHHSKPQISDNNNTVPADGISKIQYLMSKLQDKIALRDKKIQQLQNTDSDASVLEEDSNLEESLFGSKPKNYVR